MLNLNKLIVIHTYKQFYTKIKAKLHFSNYTDARIKGCVW